MWNARVKLATRSAEILALQLPLRPFQLHEPLEALTGRVFLRENDTDAVLRLGVKLLSPADGLSQVSGCVASGFEELVVSDNLFFRSFGGSTHLLVGFHQVEVVPAVVHDVDLATVQEGCLADHELNLLGKVEKAERLSGGPRVDRR